MHEDLAKYFDAVVKNNEEDAYEAFTKHIETQAKKVLKDINEAEKPIRLDGNDVLVNGKKVGTINHNSDKEDGIEFTSEEGKKSTHETLPKLFDHLTKTHKLEEGKDTLHVLQTKKKGTDKWGTQFSGTKAECTDEWRETKHDWAGHDHQIVPHVEKVAESLADSGNKELANKSEKAFKSFKNDDELKLTKQAAHKDSVDHSDAEKERAAAAKAKAKSRATVDAAAIRKVDWKL